MTEEGQKRVIIEKVKPEIDGGAYPIKRVVDEKVTVEADIFVDGHDVLAAVLLYRREKETDWTAIPMELLGNDRWRGEFLVDELGWYWYTVQAWVDHFKSWLKGVLKKIEAGQDVSVEFLIGADFLENVSKRARNADAKNLLALSKTLRSSKSTSDKINLITDETLSQCIAKYPDKQFATTYAKELPVVVDRQRARFGAWYEMFPRSCPPDRKQHNSFKECESSLPYIEAMGFDVLYLPPIHPIGHTNRKGKNNTPDANADDPGSPWAIGSGAGGHKAIHPQLGSLADFRRLVAQARSHGLEIALDIAYQCSPDHPYVKEHPEWFRWRPDGTLQYAENPPKKYEDIYPFDFENDQWQELWQELKSIIFFWIDQGIRIFRVDNPHTKSFRFWEWLITATKKQYPDVIFLAEAFTRPKVMYHLAKLGFTQSYTYFAWRNTAGEIKQYLTELTRTEVKEYYRPHLWPNTPDILTEYLQIGGRAAFMGRMVLAATLGANYGIYGPAFELLENSPREFGSEEYLDSEKYEIKYWNKKYPESLKDFIARVNRIRRDNKALYSNDGLCFHSVDNDQLICYSKQTEDLANIIVVVVNLDPHHTHTGWVELSLSEFGLDGQQPYQVHDLLSDARYIWYGSRNFVEINPHVVPAHIFSIRRRIRTERDFDYYM